MRSLFIYVCHQAMLNVGHHIAVGITHVADRFILYKILGTKMFTHRGTKSIVSGVTTADATTAIIGTNMAAQKRIMIRDLVIELITDPMTIAITNPIIIKMGV